MSCCENITGCGDCFTELCYLASHSPGWELLLLALLLLSLFLGNIFAKRID